MDKYGRRFLPRSTSRGRCGHVFQAAGLAIPTTVRDINEETTDADGPTARMLSS